MSIASDYLRDAGETVGQACKRLHANGVRIEEASRQIGYACGTELRKYFERRGLECPWPPVRPGRGHPPIQIPDSELEEYVRLIVEEKLRCAQAAGRFKRTVNAMYGAVQRRRPDLMERLRSRPGPRR